jgi:hypothetical protein
MHIRQRGAAHVPMIFFLLVLALFLGAISFAFVTHSKNGELIKARDAAVADYTVLKDRNLLVTDYIKAIGTVIGKPGQYTGRAGANYGTAAAANGLGTSFEGVMNPDEIKKLMDDKLTAMNLQAATGLENTLDAMVTKLGQLNQRVKDIESERDKQMAEKSEVDKKFQVATTEASSKAKEFATTLEQQRTDYEAAKQQQESRINTVSEGLRTTNDALSAEKERAAAKEKELDKRVSMFQIHNAALVARETLRKPEDVPDGKILVAKTGVPTAFINLGRKDLLMPGTVFRVKNPNSSAVKGYATVTRVEEERAEVSLTDFTDPVSDFARAGDLLYNNLYTPHMARTIFLMGRFTSPNKDAIAVLLKRLGNKVVDKMQPGVDTVILGDNPINEAGDGFAAVQDSPEYKLASELRVEFANMNQIRDLIKLP